MPETSHIIYTNTDEAPALGTFSLLPILQAFTKRSGIELKAWDISLSGRIIANFSDNLTEDQKIPAAKRPAPKMGSNVRSGT